MRKPKSKNHNYYITQLDRFLNLFIYRGREERLFSLSIAGVDGNDVAILRPGRPCRVDVNYDGVVSLINKVYDECGMNVSAIKTDDSIIVKLERHTDYARNRIKREFKGIDVLNKRIALDVYRYKVRVARFELFDYEYKRKKTLSELRKIEND